MVVLRLLIIEAFSLDLQCTIIFRFWEGPVDMDPAYAIVDLENLTQYKKSGADIKMFNL